ncbi:hypothetical protein BRADI_4g18013v3 [Brachypodium distachyon]|uniref:Uncharacterized protein n=1 Tax=Brachypodium distachyon TaxID=15368 RepID=A0A2K2CNK7_BRADI|nr:hypothetical protein BRADI_4g18013v3 [Brachypodium distachyon]
MLGCSPRVMRCRTARAVRLRPSSVPPPPLSPGRHRPPSPPPATTPRAAAPPPFPRCSARRHYKPPDVLSSSTMRVLLRPTHLIGVVASRSSRPHSRLPRVVF